MEPNCLVFIYAVRARVQYYIKTVQKHEPDMPSRLITNKTHILIYFYLFFLLFLTPKHAVPPCLHAFTHRLGFISERLFWYQPQRTCWEGEKKNKKKHTPLTSCPATALATNQNYTIHLLTNHLLEGAANQSAPPHCDSGTDAQTHERDARPCFVFYQARSRAQARVCGAAGARGGFASSRHVEEVNNLPARTSRGEDLLTRGGESPTDEHGF